MDTVVWKILIDGVNDLRWLDKISEIMLKYEISVVHNLGIFVIKETLSKFQ